jgi:predicted transcriptional regulator
MKSKLASTLHAVSDKEALELLRLIALTNGSSEMLRSKMSITRKQFYTRLYKLTRYGLVKKQDNIYTLTLLGQVLYEAQATIEVALGNYWKIKAIDSLEITEGFSIEGQNKLIETLVGDQEIRNILVKGTEKQQSFSNE